MAAPWGRVVNQQPAEPDVHVSSPCDWTTCNRALASQREPPWREFQGTQTEAARHLLAHLESLRTSLPQHSPQSQPGLKGRGLRVGKVKVVEGAWWVSLEYAILNVQQPVLPTHRNLRERN